MRAGGGHITLTSDYSFRYVPLSLPLSPPMSRPPIFLPLSLRSSQSPYTLVTLITAESSGSTLLDTNDCSAVTTCTAHPAPVTTEEEK